MRIAQRLREPAVVTGKAAPVSLALLVLRLQRREQFSFAPAFFLRRGIAGIQCSEFGPRLRHQRAKIGAIALQLRVARTVGIIAIAVCGQPARDPGLLDHRGEGFVEHGVVLHIQHLVRQFMEQQPRRLRLGVMNEGVAAGDDVYVGGVPAYSTIGWFADPLLNTFIHYPEPELARLLFHELAHQVLYVKDDTVFNESFATVVEQAGIARWLAAHGSDADRARYTALQRYRADFRALVTQTRNELAALYAGNAAPEEKRRRKAELLAVLQTQYQQRKGDWGGFSGYDRWFAQPLGNAHMASVAIYTQRVPAFEVLLKQQGGDLPRFYAAVRELAALPAAERKTRLDALAPLL